MADYLSEIAARPGVTLGEIRNDLLSRISGRFEIEGMERKAEHVPAPALVKPKVLDELTVVTVLLARRRIVRVDLTDGDGDEDLTLTAMYQDSGPDRGLYVASRGVLARVVSEIRPSSTTRVIDSILARLAMHAPVVRRTKEAHLVPVNNGVFDHHRQELLEFSPDWFFMSKSRVDYDAAATSPAITNPDGTIWDVESWMRSLSDDKGVPELLWEITSAVVRPSVRWDVSPWYTASAGNNGKGTHLVLLRNLVGSESVASIGLTDFGKNFQLEKLIRATAVLRDENDVGEFSDRNGDFKAAVTGDSMRIDRKHKTPVDIRFSGLIVQCFNEKAPRVKDRSGSFLRRIRLVPFGKSFTGVENKAIKDDYLHRSEVLRYVLRRVLAMQHTTLSEPDACVLEKAEYQESNDLKLMFWNEFEDQLVWDLLPAAFLHDLYKEWFRRTNPSGQPEGQGSLTTFLRDHLGREDRPWRYGTHRPGLRLGDPEHLIAEYDLKNWKNPHYSGPDLDKTCVPHPKQWYRGFVRDSVAATDDEDGDDEGGPGPDQE